MVLDITRRPEKIGEESAGGSDLNGLKLCDVDTKRLVKGATLITPSSAILHKDEHFIEFNPKLWSI